MDVFQKAMAALNSGQLGKAEKFFKALLDEQPRHIPSLNLLTVVLMASKRFAEAEKYIAKAVQLNQSSDVSFYNYGTILKQLNKPQLALEQFGKALELNRSVPETWNNRGTVHNDLQDHQSAISDFDRAIHLNSNYADAFANKAKSLGKLGRHDEAAAAYGRALALKPDLAEAWLGLGNVLVEVKRHGEALAAYERALMLKPDLAEAWLARGNVHGEHRRHDEALAAYDKALKLKPDLADGWLARGKVFGELKRHDDALAAYDKALSLKPGMAEAWLGRGNVFFDLKRQDDALEAYGNALAFKPDLAEAWLGRGNVLVDARRHEEALAAFDKALTLKPDIAEAWLGRGNVFLNLKRHDDASAAYGKALTLKPDLAEAWLARGYLLFDIKRHDKALAAYDRALMLKPGLAEAWLGRGNAFFDLARHEDALAAYDKALTVNPDLAEARLGRGNAFANLRRHDEALAAFDRVLALKPDLEGVEGSRLHVKMQLCNWTGFKTELDRLIGSMKAGKASTSPFALLSLDDGPENHLQCARLWAARQYGLSRMPLWDGKIHSHEKIRVGYVSADFHEHATAYLMAEVFELHDRAKFDVTAFSIGPDDGSNMRQRLVKSFDRFVDCTAIGDDELAAEINRVEIDVLVDLKGYTNEARPNIFACRPCPIQVNYLGYPGTMGASFLDYIIGDGTVTPMSDEGFYAEKLVHLPFSYQANDGKRGIADAVSVRADFGLPERAFVFCCFNNSYKILPEVFDAWMRILKRANDSVLWLLSDNVTAISSLRSEAASRGVAPARLVFAGQLPLAEHLARYRVADLFLDTLPYNAHTTASDALWAGLPVLTRMGNAFAGRVAASLLRAIGIPELVTHSQEEYEARAVELALDREKLLNIKDNLDSNRLTSPLFDGALFTRHLEAAYEAMYQRYQKGLSPDHIQIDR